MRETLVIKLGHILNFNMIRKEKRRLKEFSLETRGHGLAGSKK